MEESQVMTIRAFRGETVKGSCDGLPCIVVAWKPDARELAAIVTGSPIFLSFISVGIPPHFPSVSFEEAINPA